MKMDATSQQASTNGGDDGSHDPGKMFVGGLSWQTTPEGLREYFGKYGEISECMVMRDPITKRSRGFGFVSFADPTSVDKVLANGPHELDSKLIDPKVAFPRRPNATTQPKMVTRTKKIFVGGLSASTTLDDVKAYFGQFGKLVIEDAMLMFDKATQRHRDGLEWRMLSFGPRGTWFVCTHGRHQEKSSTPQEPEKSQDSLTDRKQTLGIESQDW